MDITRKNSKKEELTIARLRPTIGVIVGKCQSAMLYHLMERSILRFSELRCLLRKVTQQMLTAQLTKLEFDGIVHREVYPRVPPKVECSLTQFEKHSRLLVSAR
jgi:DNA-binding HxlR family transcriptional regulator